MQLPDAIEQTPRLHVVTCSTRAGRLGDAVAQWFAREASRFSRLAVERVDLKTFDLPVFDEPRHPRLGEYAHAHTRAWAAKVQEADAFVFVIPEYNHFPPSSFVNALTYLSREWHYKPAGFVSYGGISGGIRAVQAAKPMLCALRMVPVVESIAIADIASRLDLSRSFVATDAINAAVEPLLKEIDRLARSLRPVRAEHPPVL